MSAAAIQATFSDFRIIRGRKVCQIICEIPIEAADAALETLRGVPRPDREAWVAIARLDPKAAQQQPKGRGDAKERKRFDDLPLVQQAGIRCGEPAFWKFLAEGAPAGEVRNEEEAAIVIRSLCDVTSRTEIIKGTPSGDEFQRLMGDFDSWMHDRT